MIFSRVLQKLIKQVYLEIPEKVTKLDTLLDYFPQSFQTLYATDERTYTPSTHKIFPENPSIFFL